MIQHNIELAWMHLKKYRLQSLVCIVSLAVGFACFALAMLWIRYERTYDKCILSELTLRKLMAAVVAFPIGYICMKPWVEQYVIQVVISWWLYVGIFLANALLVILCIGWRVWKTVNAHPAEEISKG
ncbi:MAG: hypothetical protein IJ417_07395 [Bacteroidaceae bacterium]|nr:hypothetical protein [Bacteroidaceae bacterium]